MGMDMVLLQRLPVSSLSSRLCDQFRANFNRSSVSQMRLGPDLGVSIFTQSTVCSRFPNQVCMLLLYLF
jgi:hypothetical protein